MANSRKEQAATVLQKYIRSREARFQFAIETLPKDKLTAYKAFIVGNDPEIGGLKQFSTDKPFALIATSGLRALLIASQLGNSELIPKVVIVDNSRHVYAFWKNIQRFFASNKTKELFDLTIASFLRENIEDCRYIEFNAELKEVVDYFNRLFRLRGFGYISKMISATVILRQDWQDPNTFKSLKNIFNATGIEDVYMYPSNIVAYCYDDKKVQEDILSNIQLINPKLCIHTDMPDTRAENVYLVTKHEPDAVKKIVFSAHHRNLAPSGSLRQRLSALFTYPLHLQLIDNIKILATDMNVLSKITPLLDAIGNHNYSRALRIAANYKNGLQFAEQLLHFKDELNIDINEQAGDEKNAALHLAGLKGHKDIYDLLIQHGADRTLANKQGLTPAMMMEKARQCRV